MRGPAPCARTWTSVSRKLARAIRRRRASTRREAFSACVRKASSRTPRCPQAPARLVLPPTRPQASGRQNARRARQVTTATQAAAAARALPGRRQLQGASS
eukprot:768367-Hanusia_phi.AAC.4